MIAIEDQHMHVSNPDLFSFIFSCGSKSPDSQAGLAPSLNKYLPILTGWSLACWQSRYPAPVLYHLLCGNPSLITYVRGNGNALPRLHGSLPLKSVTTYLLWIEAIRGWSGWHSTCQLKSILWTISHGIAANLVSSLKTMSTDLCCHCPNRWESTFVLQVN